MDSTTVLPVRAALTRMEMRVARSHTVHKARRVKKVVLVCGAVLSVMTTVALVIAGCLVFLLHLSIQPVLTSSMLPTYGPGWAVVMRPIPVRDVRPGMIIQFSPPGLKTGYVHRVVTVSGSPDRPVITTKGDANPYADPWHAELTTASVPRVVFQVPYLGTIMLHLQQKSTRFGLMGFGGFSIAGAGTASIISPRSRRKRKTRRDPGRGKIAPQTPRRTSAPSEPAKPCFFVTTHRSAAFCHVSVPGPRCAFLRRPRHQVSLCPKPHDLRGAQPPTNGRDSQ